MLVASFFGSGHSVCYVGIGETHTLCRLHRSGKVLALPEDRVETEKHFVVHYLLPPTMAPYWERGGVQDAVHVDSVAPYIWHWLNR